MTYLKFYQNEREEFPNIYAIKIPPRDVKTIINKLVRHYKLPKVNVKFYKRKAGAGCYTHYNYKRCVLDFCPKGVNLGIIIHEVAHHYQRVKTGGTNHSKKLMSIIRRINKYCAKMKYWGYEIERE